VSVQRLLALLLVLAIAVAVSVGGAVASAGVRSSDAATTKAAKRSQAARCAKPRGTTKRARLRRAAARRTPGGCVSARTMRLGAKKQVAAVGPWFTAPTAPAAPVPGTAPGAPATGDPIAPPPAPPPPAPVVSTLGVGAYDMDGFVLRLTRTSVPAGILTIFFRNHDVSDHNLWISSPDGEIVERISDTVGEDGGDSRTLPVTAGAWRLFCALPDHGAMTRTLTVTP
jgi:hypothetical protein